MSAGTAPEVLRSPPATRGGTAILVALGGCIVALVVVAALGASDVEPRLPGGGHWPPWTMHGLQAHPLGVVVALITTLIVSGITVALALRATAHGWTPRPARLLGAGLLAVLALTLVPATGSADPESYAAYGRMASVGRDPYRTTPAQMVAIGDPIAAAVEDPWKNTASVYGPLATAEQRFASSIGERSVRTTVVVLSVINAVGFALTGLLLYFAATGEVGRRRAALLWMLNPLLLFELVSGAHIDCLVTLFAVASVVAVSRSRLLAGALIGLAAAIKLPAAAILVGLVWARRRNWREVGALVLGAGAVLAVSYSTVSSHALGRSLGAGKLASWATPWRGGISLLDATVGRPESRTVMSLVAALIAVAFAVVLLRKETKAPDPDAMKAAATAGFFCYFAYLLAAPYALPWYDAPAWGLLVLMAPSVLDLLMIARTTALAAAYVTHDEPHLRPSVHHLVVAMRNVVSPLVLTGVLVATVVLVRRKPQS